MRKAVANPGLTPNDVRDKQQLLVQ